MEKTRAIILKQIKYSDSSLIVDAFTERFGRLSCIVSGVKGGKSKMKAGFFQPGTMVELVLYMKKGRDLKRIKEVSPYYIYENLPYDVIKSASAQFVVEFVLHTISEPEEQQDLYAFVEQSLHYLDTTDRHLRNFPIFFGWHLSTFLGFEPNMSHPSPDSFDLTEGTFNDGRAGGLYSLNRDSAEALYRILQTTLEQVYELKIHRSIREDLLQKVQIYFQLHIEKFKPLKSPDIFHAIFHVDS